MDGILMQKNIDDSESVAANNFRKALMGQEMYQSIRDMLDYLAELQKESDSHVVVKNIQTKFRQILQDNRVGIV